MTGVLVFCGVMIVLGVACFALAKSLDKVEDSMGIFDERY